METRGRKPLQTQIAAREINDELLTADMAAVNAVTSIEAGYTEERDLVNQLLGQIQMANSFARFADVVSLSKLKHIKENKSYRALAGQKGVDQDGKEIADVGTFDGFCRALGLSRTKVDEDLTNLDSFGEDALKSLASIGAGYRELRQYRRLPDDQKTALIEAAKSGDKDSFLDLAEELISRHAKEKAEIGQQLQAKDSVIESKQKLIDHQADEIDGMARKVRFVATATPEERYEGIRTELLGYAASVEGMLAGKLKPCFAALKAHIEEHGGEVDAYLSSTLGQIERGVRELREEFGLLRAEDVAVWANAE